MKRRDLLKSGAAITVTPFFAKWAGASPVYGENIFSDNPEAKTNGIPRFGDGRDWFFEQRYGMFVHWGFKKDEDYYTDRHLISSIDRYLGRDANYLLNVGPTGEGIIPTEAAAILKRVGQWKKSVGESFLLKPINVMPSKATLLNTGKPILN